MSEMSSAALWQPPSLRVVNPAADQLTYEQTLEQARQQGYREGLQQGQQEGRQQARAMLAEMSALWDAMQQPFADMEHAVHTELMGLVVAMAEAVLQRELATDRELIRQSLETALDALGSTENTVEVVLNPKDADLVSGLLADEGIDHRLKPDPNMMPGGCRLRHGHALVDARVETLIARTVANVAERARVTDAGGNESARALDPEEIQAIARRFAAGPETPESAPVQASSESENASSSLQAASSSEVDAASSQTVSPSEAEPVTGALIDDEESDHVE